MTENDEPLSERYLQISRNLMNTFPKYHPPVRLFVWDDMLERVELFHEADRRMKPEKQQDAVAACLAGRLYLNREDYRVYAQHLSKHLGLVLTEDGLDDRDVAEIFFHALCERLAGFHEQPTKDNIAGLRGDLGILCEYLWTNPCRIGCLARTLDRDYSPEVHAVNCIFIGLGLRVMLAGRDLERLELNSLALGLAVHDVGMTRVPGFIKDKPSVLMHSDRQTVKKHPDTGMSMLSRLKVRDPVVEECVQGHHERVDGSGYPGRLKGDQVGIYARICGLADAFCAAVGERPYRDARDVEKAASQFFDDLSFDSRLTSLLAQLIERREENCPLPFIPRER